MVTNGLLVRVSVRPACKDNDIGDSKRSGLNGGQVRSGEMHSALREVA